jgi:uncharacterized damage-inducible protein DinB
MSSHDLTAFEFLYYNRWANLKLIDILGELAPKQLDASLPGSYGNIYDTLRHIIRAEAAYYHRLTGTRLPPPFSWDDHPSIAEIRPYAEQVSSALLEAAGELARTDRIVTEEEEGEIFRYKALALLIQIVNHGIEHRTNITTILAQLGIQAPDIAGWGYLESNLDRLGG